MDTKFSKGEWWACCLKKRPHFVFAGENKVVCGIQHNDPNEPHYEILEEILTVEESVANAKLIMAAPCLLKALLEIVYERDGEWFIGIDGDACVSDIVKEAIKKATE